MKVSALISLRAFAENIDTAANLAHYEFLNFAAGYAFHAQLMGGINTVPSVDETWMKILEGSIPATFLNFLVVAEMTSAYLKGLATLPAEAPLIRSPVPLDPENMLVQVQAAACESMLSFIFNRLDPSLLDRLILYKNKTPGNLQCLFWSFYEAKLIYGLAALGTLPDPDVHLETARKAVERMHFFATSAFSHPIFCTYIQIIPMINPLRSLQFYHIEWLKPTD